MKYITSSDWDMQIRTQVLAVVRNSEAALQDAIDAAISEAQSYLLSKYDINKIFAPVYDWDAAATYPIDTRIRFVANEFRTVIPYSENDLVHFQGNIFKAKDAITAGSFKPAEWDEIAKQNSHYHVITETTTASFLPTSNEYAAGDTRHPYLLALCKDITLYHIHSNISPNNIPELRAKRYDAAIKWLTLVSSDKLAADLPLINTDQALGAMRFGGNTKYSQRW